jgi:hypothetical protein
MDINDIINGCGNLLQQNQNVVGHINKFNERKGNYHDESMLTLVLANAFAADRDNRYANVCALLTQVMSHRKSELNSPILTQDHSVFIEYQIPNLKHYNDFVRDNWFDDSFPRHPYKDSKDTIDNRLKNGDKHDIEGSTHFDMVITCPNMDRVYFESKYISDIDCKTSYVPCRDQITRCLDAALYDVTDNFENPEGIKHLWFFLITPEMFRIEEFGGSGIMDRIFRPERSRLYSYKMRDLTEVQYLEYNFPHLRNLIDLKLLSERIFWMTWEEAAHFAVSNILVGEHAELVKSFFHERNLWWDNMSSTKRVISNVTFDKAVESVKATKSDLLRAIQESLYDLTALKLWRNVRETERIHISRYWRIFQRMPVDIVVFDVESLMNRLGIDNEFDFWDALLGRVPNPVFDRSAMKRNRIDNDITDSVEGIYRRIRRLYEENEIINDELSTFLTKLFREGWYRESNRQIEDLLGVFFSCDNIRIELYAQVIAYFSIILGVSSERLANVVLTHEMAHAYTMAGLDIGGNQGNLLCSSTDKYVIEGLAQYYTEAVCDQLEDSFPGILDAFLKLRDRQTAPYTWYQYWFDGKQDHERIRYLLLRYRDDLDYGYFKSHLELSNAVLNSIL